MRLVLSVLLIAVTINAPAQFQLEQKKGKSGVSLNGSILYKPKADSVYFSDSIATVYQKKKIIYINTSGEKIYKAKIENGWPFHNDFAIIKNKKGKYGAINSSGEEVISLFHDVPPTYYGNFLLAHNIFGQGVLYTKEGRLKDKISKVDWLHDWIVVERTTEEQYTYYEKRFLRKKEKKTGYKYYKNYFIYHAYNQELITTNGHFQDFGDFVLFHQDDGTSLHSTSSEVVIKHVSDVSEVNETYLQFKQKDSFVLYDRMNKKEFIRGDYIYFQLNKNSIYAVKDSSTGVLDMSIYDYQGQQLKTNLGFVRNLDEQRSVFMVDTVQYIGNEIGDQLSDKYVAFGERMGNYRVVYFGASYGYINDKTYKLLPIEYPLMARRYSSGGGRRRGGIFRAFGHMVESFVRILTLQRPKPLGAGYSGGYDYTKLEEAGKPFNNGWARVCLYGSNQEKRYDSLLVVESYEKTPYNYVDTNGTLMNSRKYNYASEFQNGRAYVLSGNYYYIIDSTGKNVDKRKYSHIKEGENGYFEAEYKFNDYILNDKFEVVANCDCFDIMYLEDGIYNRRSGDTTLLYKYPNPL